MVSKSEMSLPRKYITPKRPDKYAFWKRIQAQRTRGMLQSIKENTPCADCGNSYPYYVMEFDHVIPKNKTSKVSAITSLSRLKIFEELSKCDVVCANCHKARTYIRNPSRDVTRPFGEWIRKHIVSLVPIDGKFLVVCSSCSGHYLSDPLSIRWETENPEMYCSLTCGIRSGSNYWWARHRNEIREFMGDSEFKTMLVARQSRTDESVIYRLTWENGNGNQDHPPLPGGVARGAWSVALYTDEDIAKIETVSDCDLTRNGEPKIHRHVGAARGTTVYNAIRGGAGNNGRRG